MRPTPRNSSTFSASIMTMGFRGAAGVDGPAGGSRDFFAASVYDARRRPPPNSVSECIEGICSNGDGALQARLRERSQ